MVFKVISAGMVIVFIASCAVQYNDPDPLTWVIAYGIAGVFSAIMVLGLVLGQVAGKYVQRAIGRHNQAL